MHTPHSLERLARIRQGIINKQDRIIKNLTASIVQLENDYDLVEAQLNAAEATQQASK